MKTLKLIGMALLAVVLSVNFTACSDDDDEETPSTDILGLWECYEIVDGDSDMSLGVGQRLKFLSNEVSYLKPTAAWGVNGKKCFVSDEDGTFEITTGDYDTYYVDDPTEAQWNVGSEYDDDGTCVDFSNEIYVLNGDSLSIVNSSNDWWRGSISIDNDVMTYTYVTQYGSSTTGKMSDNVSGPFISKFQRQ